jgi:diaminohydroxyphosphoribosylaminopyrimidine deaminase/5-amino-6-(5-phosphoribosylamino)uracil reductase
MVGAVLVRQGQIIGRGYHRNFGEKHAEVNAIEDAGGNVDGATLYVTLEPCCHYGKTPPCVEAIIQRKISRVVIGTKDPNPIVNGKGIEILRSQRIEVETGLLEKECLQLNEAYFKYIQTGLPFITIKYAQTLDGRIATTTGDSHWISSTPSLKYAHWLRNINDGLIVGIGTILVDDPRLDVRLVKGRNPIPIVVDSRLRIPLSAKVLNHSGAIVATTLKADAEKVAKLIALKADVLIIEEDYQGRVDLAVLLKELGRRGIASILVEGGSEIITSFLKNGLADKLITFIAPKIIGKGIAAIGDLGITELSQAISLSVIRVRKMGNDYLLELQVNH